VVCLAIGGGNYKVFIVMFALCRQRFVTDKTAMYTLVEKHMSLEHRQQIIPIAHAGNEVVPRH